MTSIASYLIAAVLLAAAGAAALGVGAFERRMAAAEERLVTQRYEEAAEALTAAEELATYARWMPGTGQAAERDLDLHRASLRYWDRQYQSLLPRDADPVGAVEPEHVALRLVVANSAYRDGQARVEGTAATVQMLDEAIAGYLTVLSGETWDERAAYNYEYLLRVRDELARGRRTSLPPPPEEGASLGAAGAPAETSAKGFEIYIPLEGEERNDAAEAGKAAPKGRKG
jgi:hypothetical protein